MPRWFEEMDGERPHIISSRIRLARNLSGSVFPGKLDEKRSRELIHSLEFGLKDLGAADGKTYRCAMLEDLEELDRTALRERRVLNSSILEKKEPVGLMVSEEEDVSLVLGGDDHVRIQLLQTGLHLDELWERADRLDDYVSERFPYAFDERYGYLTSFPTNMGTGLRASVVVHLPKLSQGKKFSGLIGDMSRFGTTVRGVYGEGGENYGALYEISNQKTLGQTEKEIIDVVARAAVHLTNQERQVEKLTLQRRRLEWEDEIYKSYGVLKYARRLTAKDAMIFLSQLMAGISAGVLKTEEECSVYRLMLGIQPANLQKLSEKPLNKEELDAARADFLRGELPTLQ